MTDWQADRLENLLSTKLFFFPVKTLKVERKEKIETSSTCCKTLTDMAPQTLISNRSLALHMSPFFPLLAYSCGGCVKAKWVNNTRSCLSRCFSLDKYKRLYFLMLMSISKVSKFYVVSIRLPSFISRIKLSNFNYWYQNYCNELSHKPRLNKIFSILNQMINFITFISWA